ncbi:MAG: lipid-binding SYLF domain-containing protein [Pseudomonadota bacterium]
MGWVVAAALFAATPAHADSPQDLVGDAQATVEQLITDPDFENLRGLLTRARGVVVVPALYKAGLIIGGEVGEAVLLAHDLNTGAWSYPAFMTMASGSVGLQIGASVNQVVLVIMTDDGMEAMLADKIEIGGDASVAAGPVGVNAKAATTSTEFDQDIYAYGTGQGLFAGVAVEGAILIPDEDTNQLYYGEAATTREIVQAGTVSNDDADGLRAALTGIDPE